MSTQEMETAGASTERHLTKRRIILATPLLLILCKSSYAQQSAQLSGNKDDPISKDSYVHRFKLGIKSAAMVAVNEELKVRDNYLTREPANAIGRTEISGRHREPSRDKQEQIPPAKPASKAENPVTSVRPVQPKLSLVRMKILAAAKSAEGKPYKHGASGPDAYDCSGLVKFAYLEGAALDVKPPTTSLLANAKMQFSRSQVMNGELVPGDLIFFHDGADQTTNANNVTHVGILGESEEFIHAPRPGRLVHKVGTAEYALYWTKRIAFGARYV